ncbi:MAG: AAA family ATPase, partial [Myxococcales bacterium]|nr:AAA family ATPase [Myxococcales bacterium]
TTLALFEEETYAGDDGVGDLERIADAPPVPVSFRRSARSERPPALVGAGLGLFGMRPLPIVGRDEERKLLWRMLREVASSTRPRLVFLRGPSGCGKSRLAEWISERAHELGSATVMRASHAAVPGPSHGLGAMLAAYFGCSGAPRDGVISLLRATLDEGPAFDHLALALTEIIAPLEGPPQTSVPPPSGGATSRRVRFADMHEQHAVIAQLFRWLSMSRPVLMWLDDVQWSASALALSEYLLDQEGIRLFIIATEQTEVTTKRPVERARIERLIARGADTLPLEPLTIDEHRELVRHLLGLEGKLASRVEKLTLDSPLFAVQLVGDWVQRGVLLSSDQGFRLREGERAELPDSLHALWERRVAQLAEGHDREAFLEALEIAALLGDRVDRREWQDVCERRGVRLPRDIEGSLVESGLARVIPMGFGFCHALLRESLERSAERNQRAVAHHRACAAMLEERFADLAATAERLAHHLYVAGAPEAAIHHLDRAIAFRFDRGDFDRVDHLLEQREAALAEALGTTSTGNDPRHVTGELWRIRVLLARDEFESAARVLRRTEGVAHVHRDIASLCQLHAELRWARGQMVEAADLARGAQKQFEALDDPVAAADCRRIVVKCNLESRGDFREALSEARLAREVYVEAHDLDRIAECDYLEAKILTELLDFDGAKHACAAARSHHDGQGHRLGVARCENQWGEIARLQGELETAEQSYLRAAALLEAMGSEAAAGVRLNLAIVLVARGRYRRAEGELVELREQMTKRGHERALGFIDYALLPCLASEGKWSELDALLGHAARRIPAEGRVDKDFAALAEKAADLAMGAGQAERADQLRALASEHYRALGLSGEVERVEAERASTRPPPSG